MNNVLKEAEGKLWTDIHNIARVHFYSELILNNYINITIELCNNIFLFIVIYLYDYNYK